MTDDALNQEQQPNEATLFNNDHSLTNEQEQLSLTNEQAIEAIFMSSQHEQTNEAASLNIEQLLYTETSVLSLDFEQTLENIYNEHTLENIYNEHFNNTAPEEPAGIEQQQQTTEATEKVQTTNEATQQEQPTLTNNNQQEAGEEAPTERIVYNGRTATRFKDTADRCAKTYSEVFSYTRLRPQLKECVQEELDIAEIADQAQLYLKTNITRATEEVLKKYDVVAKCNLFDDLIQEAKKRPSVEQRIRATPEQLKREFLYMQKQKELQALRASFEKMKRDNSQMMLGLETKSKDVVKKKARVDEKRDTLKKTISLTTEMNPPRLVKMTDELQASYIT